MIKIDKIHFQLKYPLLFNTKSQANPVLRIFSYAFFNLCYSSIIIFKGNYSCLRKCVMVLEKYSHCVRVEFRIGADCIEWTSTMTLYISQKKKNNDFVHTNHIENLCWFFYNNVIWLLSEDSFRGGYVKCPPVRDFWTPITNTITPRLSEICCMELTLLGFSTMLFMHSGWEMTTLIINSVIRIISF